MGILLKLTFMKSVLIFGGTKYLGKALLKKIKKKFNITVLSRKKTKISSNIDSFIINRDSKKSIENFIHNKKFDFVIDFINYSSFHSSIIHDLIVDKALKCGHYIMISTTWIYNKGKSSKVTENNFDPSKYNYEVCQTTHSYEESKRNSESFIVQKFIIPYSIVRFPMILSSDDYTKRFNFIPNHLKNREISKNPCTKKFQVIFKDDAVNFLLSLIKKSQKGIFHFSGKELLSEKSLWNFFLKFFEEKSKFKKVEIANSPFKFSYDLILDCKKSYEIYKPGNTFDLFEKEFKKFKKLHAEYK